MHLKFTSDNLKIIINIYFSYFRNIISRPLKDINNIEDMEKKVLNEEERYCIDDEVMQIKTEENPPNLILDYDWLPPFKMEIKDEDFGHEIFTECDIEMTEYSTPKNPLDDIEKKVINEEKSYSIKNKEIIQIKYEENPPNLIQDCDCPPPIKMEAEDEDFGNEIFTEWDMKMTEYSTVKIL